MKNKPKTTLTRNLIVVIFLLQGAFLLQACSGSNGFHLRKNTDLPVPYQKLQLKGLSVENSFSEVFEQELEEAGGILNQSAPIKIKFSDLIEGRRVIAYTSERVVREYLLYLKFSYEIVSLEKPSSIRDVKKYSINIDRSYLYDPDFALGKAEEEKQVKENLYKEAARLILLKLRYSNKKAPL